MTAALPQQTVPVKDAAAVRKRRRRAPAGGAADDCFTCTKRNVKCDRRRPYCSQCLEIGNECSGYKTQLTWGVGVASRGKLRGLSLPIAKAPPVLREPKKSPQPRARTNSIATSQWSEQEEHQRLPRAPIDISVAHAASAPATPYPVPGGGYDYLAMSHPENTPPLHHGAWGSMPYSPGIMHSPDVMPKYNKYPMPIMTDALSSSIDSVNSEVHYVSPISQSFPREEMPFIPSPTLMYEPYPTHHQHQHHHHQSHHHQHHHSSPMPPSPPAAMVIDHPRAGNASCPGLVYTPSEPSSSLTSHMDHFEAHLGHKMVRESENLRLSEVDGYGTSFSTAGGDAWASVRRRDQDLSSSPLSEHATSQWPTVAEPPTAEIQISPELLSKMPFFMDYYKSTMCPSMVFTDGAQNPFRDHVMQLAANSQSLRHAICALAACNLRMKRKLSLGHDTRDLSEKLLHENMSNPEPEDQALTEEYQHRNLAVHLLNQQLNDQVKSTDDSILATILLLCHYRMVESGIAKFHTQFAGVKKILALRAQSATASGESSWMEALFTYFDAISASINDREAQLLDTNEAQMLPPGAENLVGCDRTLFKTISKLGRLNLLSQHRPVRDLPELSGSKEELRRSQSPLGTSLGHVSKSRAGGIHDPQLRDLYNIPAHRFDGNGFGTMMDDEEMLASAAYSSVSYDDQRSMFWKEWKEARLALQNWQFDAAAVAASMPGNPTAAQMRDLGSLSEAFRYAALLYTERLASPNLPSNHINFQNLVSQVVYYATSLESGSAAEKFLLWPLFVAGSECVNELQQGIVRTKCRDIMARSGYMNNLAALDVLERLWAGEFNDSREPKSAGFRLGPRRGAFSWTKCIGGLGMGVEWIMF
ncbi:hypothetical protein HJFPF1_11447 [Paramyrothecium foliicola]|nr:hypothetical protein HJFPF1_11447 [Paramyrothecium foliicola]